jgi:hypothetical protein
VEAEVAAEAEVDLRLVVAEEVVLKLAVAEEGVDLRLAVDLTLSQIK